jgi:hypothetical protein
VRSSTGLKDKSAPDLMKRYRPLIDSLQPSARFWAERQAKIEAKRPALDLNALRTAILTRFAGQLPSTDPLQPFAGLVDGGDVAEMAVIVILMMVQDGDKDLQEQMLEAEAQMAAKQALRNLIDEMQQLAAQIAGANVEAPGEECTTPGGVICVCTLNKELVCDTGPTCALPVQVSCQCVTDVPIDLNQGSSCTTPNTSCTVGITTQQLASVIVQLQDKLDSDNEMSEQATMRLQMLMDARSKLLKTASDIERSLGDAEETTLENLN